CLVGARELLGQRFIRLIEILTPFRVADQHAVHSQVEQHRRGNLAGECSVRRLMHVLGIDPQRAAGCGGDRLGKGRVRHADRDVDVIRQQPGELPYQTAGLGGRLVHLPVAWDEGAARAHTGDPASASTPGSGRPSISSSAAPPPVDTWVIWSATPAALTAATESPPPTTDTASDA